MCMKKIKLFSMTSVNFRLILSVTAQSVSITDIFKTVMNPGIACHVVAKIFLSAPYQATTTFWFVVPISILTSCSGEI